MVKREKYTSPIRCPECEKKGEVEWEENENPMHADGRFDRELVSVSFGFCHVSGGRENPVVQCVDCNITVPI